MPRPRELTPEDKAAAARTLANDLEGQVDLVRDDVAAIGLAAADGDLAAWSDAHRDAVAGVAHLRGLAQKAAAALTDAGDAEVRTRLEAAGAMLAEAEALVAGAPVPRRGAPVLGCGDALLAALPLGTKATAADERAFVDVFTRQATYADIEAFRTIVGEHEGHPITRRFRTFGKVTQKKLLRILADRELEERARARQAAQRRARRVTARRVRSGVPAPASTPASTPAGAELATTDTAEIHDTTSPGAAAAPSTADDAENAPVTAGSPAPASEQPTPGATDKTIASPQRSTSTAAHSPNARAGVDPGSAASVAVQRQATAAGAAPEAASVAEVGRRGVAGAGGPLPYAAQIQASFGKHDVSSVRAHQDPAAAEASRALGASAYAMGNAVAFGTSPDLHTAAHEAAHTVQQRGGVQLAGGIDQPGDAYERHADAVADAVVAGTSAEALLDAAPGGPATGHPALQRKADHETGASGTPPPTSLEAPSPEPPGKVPRGPRGPDLHGAPYQWVPGTFSLWVSRDWLLAGAGSRSDGASTGPGPAAPDVNEVRQVAPPRVRELLGVLRDKGMLRWASPERIAKTAVEIDIDVGASPVFQVHLRASAFDALGLPPGTSAMVDKTSDHGLDAVIAVPDAQGEEGNAFALSPPARQQLVAALEGFTHLAMVPAERQKVLDTELKAKLGAGTARFSLNAATCAQLFGKAEYEAWLRKPAGAQTTLPFDAAAGDQRFGDLTPEEVAFIKTWLARHLPGGASAPAVAMSRGLLDALHALDGLSKERRQRVLALLHGTGKAGKEAADHQLSGALLARLIERAGFDEEREAAGFKDNKAPGQERPPVFDTPFPARIDQRNGLVLDGEQVDFTLLIDWPTAYTADQDAEYTWRPQKAKIDWLFERDNGKKHQARQTSHVDWKHDGRTTHAFRLDRGEDAGTWSVHAFVQHNFFQPRHLVTQVEVKTEQKRLEETREEAFQALGAPSERADHDFSTSPFNEAVGDRAYDHGSTFRGEIPADFQRRTPAQRQETLANEIKSSEAMLVYLRAEGTHPEAIAACEHYLAKLRDAAAAMGKDVQQGWQPFELRGTFLGRGNHTTDGPLDLYGAVQRQGHVVPSDASDITTYEQVHVQIRDLSRRLEAENYRFEGSGNTFEQALEAAFLDLCKKYPGGTLSILAEGLAPEGKAATGKTVGFALDTGTAWKDVKAKVFDPVVNIAVNIAGAIAAIFVPEIAIPVLILYNEAQNVDQLVDEIDSGRLTVKAGAMHLAQLGFDIMPLANQAPIFRTSKAAFRMFHIAGLSGQMLLMKTQVTERIAQIRDGQVQDMAQLFAQYVDLEKSTQASDPTRTRMKAELDRRAEQIRQTALQVWDEAIVDFAAVAVPSHLAGVVHEQLRIGRIKQLETSGRFLHRDGIEPHYDPRRGQIVGDPSRLDRQAMDRLTREQDAHMRELGGRLAGELGVDPDKLVFRPDTENRIWQDGDRVQVRYAADTDFEQALAGWKRDARNAKIGKPGAGARGRGEAAAAPAREAARTDHPRPAAEHETVSNTAKIEPELVGGGHSQARETTAAAVPGSAFRGGVRAGDAAEVVASAHAAFETAARRFGDVTSVEKVASAHVDLTAPGGFDEKLRLDSTYLLTMQDGSAFTIRITSGPIGGDAVARTVVNTTKTGVNKVARPGEASPVNVAIEGRYVVQLAETIDPANAERAIAHEVGEILAQREIAAGDGRAKADVLVQKPAPRPDAPLSPHDRGRLGEIKVLAAKVNAGDASATRELLALVEELGLRDGMEGANERRHLVTQALGNDAVSIHALEQTWKPEAQLAADLKTQLDTIHRGRQQYAVEAEARKAADKPIHEMPDARSAPGKIITPERAHELALEAAIARANKSKETVHRLRSEARQLPDGKHPRIQDVQIGGGGALAARDPAALLIDARGRWQADASDRIAQTANQLAGLKDAGFGDPFQFAQPNERVPMAAVKFWEDSIAAQGPVIDGQVTSIALDGDGKTILTIAPTDGPPPLHVEVAGNVLMATGFPVERLPGTPRRMTPELAVDQIKTALQKLVDDPATPRGQKAEAQGALRELADVTGLESKPGQRGDDLTKVNAVLKHHHLDGVVSADPALQGARDMALAGEKWDKLAAARPDKVVLGDTANLASIRPEVTDKWVIGGLGGTGVSAAEIILAKNDRAHVTMVGDKPPPGLIDNGQFMDLLKKHADAQTVAQLKAVIGMEIPPGDGRVSLVFGVEVETPTMDSQGQVHATGKDKPADWVPPGFTVGDNPMVGGGYISAIGRENQLPPVAAALKDNVEANGGRMTMEPMYNTDDQYTHYRLRAFDAVGAEIQHIDVTGAASRFPPWELMEGRPEDIALARDKFWAASDLDAPPEGGNFDGGLVASSTQGARYAKAKRAGGFR